MRVTFCGVRGSIETPGAEFAGLGGNTSCVALGLGDAAPELILDAGSGIRAVTSMLGGRPFRGTILLSHLHWDHTHGLPFFAGADRPGAKVAVLAPAQARPLVEVVAQTMAPPHFPITPLDLRGDWRFDGIEEGLHEVGGFEVLAREIPHKGGRTFGYRINVAGSSLAYLPDHCPTRVGPGSAGFGELHDAALELAAGVDVLVHDAQLLTAELPERAEFGHAAAAYAVELAVAAEARHVVLFHHDPERTDQAAQAVLREGRARARGDLGVSLAHEGLTLDIGDRRRRPAP